MITNNVKEFERVPKLNIDKEQFKALIAGIAAFVSKAVVVSPHAGAWIETRGCRDRKGGKKRSVPILYERN